jgi:RNA-binding protein YhbY
MLHQFAVLYVCLLPCVIGFFAPIRAHGRLSLRSSIEDGGADRRSSIEDGQTRELWQAAPKALLNVGRKGAESSHIRSLGELLTNHAVVKVKLSDHRTDYTELASVLSTAENAKLADVHPSKRYLLFVQAEPRAIPNKAVKFDTRLTKTCRTCGEVGHIAVDCPTTKTETDGAVTLEAPPARK